MRRSQACEDLRGAELGGWARAEGRVGAWRPGQQEPGRPPSENLRVRVLSESRQGLRLRSKVCMSDTVRTTCVYLLRLPLQNTTDCA